MILSFKEKLFGKPTYFKAKILMSLPPYWWTQQDHNFIRECSRDLALQKIKIGNSLNPGILIPKLHTIRKGRGWQKGTKIHFAKGVRTKNYHCWLNWHCFEVQTVKMYFYNDVGGDDCIVMIDEKRFPNKQLHVLARNDGFNNLSEFLKYFVSTSELDKSPDLKEFPDRKVFIGQIIHWTPFKY